MSKAWDREFDAVLEAYRPGLAKLHDMPSEDIAHIHEMRDLGMTPEEAYDVLTEVDDVE